MIQECEVESFSAVRGPGPESVLKMSLSTPSGGVIVAKYFSEFAFVPEVGSTVRVDTDKLVGGTLDGFGDVHASIRDRVIVNNSASRVSLYEYIETKFLYPIQLACEALKELVLHPLKR